MVPVEDVAAIERDSPFVARFTVNSAKRASNNSTFDPLLLLYWRVIGRFKSDGCVLCVLWEWTVDRDGR